MDEKIISQVVEKVLRETDRQEITLAIAKSLAEKIEKQAEQMGIAVVIAVADRAARPIMVHCMDHAYIAGFDIALHKAYTSAALQMSTAELAVLSQPQQPLYGIQFTNEGKIVIFGGGEVLEYSGKLLGALGVSGGTLEQDIALAAYGKEILKEVLECR